MRQVAKIVVLCVWVALRPKFPLAVSTNVTIARLDARCVRQINYGLHGVALQFCLDRTNQFAAVVLPKWVKIGRRQIIARAIRQGHWDLDST
ncbi:hypothetical protein C0Q88_25320 [Ralstonia pickettii]|uniref:Uncharacterized protein n=1 Tax=Ralstonia pickettii TaxID=329 RepID=A0A2N4TJY6_RALPI|nr:hypothetical protein C0Q88_25320 [Ralstonia pickettii]